MALCLVLLEAEGQGRQTQVSPVSSAAEEVAISSLVDQTFLVISNGHTTRTQARRAQEQLERAHATLTGLVVLDV